MKKYEEFDLPEQYNEGPNKLGKLIEKPYKLVDDGTGLTFMIYKGELLSNARPGERNVELARLSSLGDPIKFLRAKRGSTKDDEIKRKTGESKRRTEKKKKQIEDLSVMVRELLADPDLVKNMTKKLPEWADYVDEPNAAALIIGSAIMKAMDVKAPGQIQAAEFLRKVGWGDKYDVNVTGEVGFFEKPTINFEIIEPQEAIIQELPEGETKEDE